MTSAPAIKTGWVDSSPLPPERQFDSWAAHSRNTRITPGRSGGFLAKGAIWELAGAIVAESYLDPFVAERDEAMMAVAPADHLLVVALLEGSVRFETPDLNHDCAAPDVFLCDYARPSRLEAQGIHCVTVYLGRDFLEQACGPVEAHGLLPRSAETRLLADILKAMTQVLPFAAATSSGHYARMLRDLVAAAVAGLPRRGPVGRAAGSRTRAEAYVLAQSPGALSVAAMTEALGMTRSVLYGLFKTDGGVLAYDRSRRLRALYRDVSDPAETRTLAELGAAQGFLDSAVLSRTFRARFGCSLSEVRARARAAEPLSPGADAIDRLRQSVMRLSAR